MNRLLYNISHRNYEMPPYSSDIIAHCTVIVFDSEFSDSPSTTSVTFLFLAASTITCRLCFIANTTITITYVCRLQMLSRIYLQIRPILLLPFQFLSRRKAPMEVFLPYLLAKVCNCCSTCASLLAPREGRYLSLSRYVE